MTNDNRTNTELSGRSRSTWIAAATMTFAAGLLVGSGWLTPEAHAQQGEKAFIDAEKTPVQIYQVQPPTSQIRNGELTWALVGAADGRYYLVDSCGIARRATLESGADLYWRDTLLEATEINIDAR